MKKILLVLLTLNFQLSAFNSLFAQKTPLEKYELAPAPYERVYLDHVLSNPCRIIDIGSNQYLGQVDKQHKLYGYGMFINDDGSQIIGKFRDDLLLFGITLTQSSAIVGDRNFYASYSLTTGRLEYVFHANAKELVDARSQLDYGFVSMKYPNGDQYVGEVYERQRHGYGIYYYRNGDFWFGQYNHDYRTGFGALFHVEGGLEIGEWKGEDEVRVITIKSK